MSFSDSISITMLSLGEVDELMKKKRRENIHPCRTNWISSYRNWINDFSKGRYYSSIPTIVVS